MHLSLNVGIIDLPVCVCTLLYMNVIKQVSAAL